MLCCRGRAVNVVADRMWPITEEDGHTIITQKKPNQSEQIHRMLSFEGKI